MRRTILGKSKITIDDFFIFGNCYNTKPYLNKQILKYDTTDDTIENFYESIGAITASRFTNMTFDANYIYIALNISRRLYVIDKSTGAIDTAWPTFNSSILSIRVDDDHVYLGGGFTGTNKQYFCVIDKATKTVETGWPQTFTDAVVHIQQDATTLYVFNNSNGMEITKSTKASSTQTYLNLSTAIYSSDNISYSIKDGDNIYLTYRDYTYGYFKVVDVSSKTVETGWPSITTKSSLWSFDSDATHIFLYADDYFYRINKSTKAIDDSLAVTQYNGNFVSSLIADDDYVYLINVGSPYSPAGFNNNILAIDKSTWTLSEHYPLVNHVLQIDSLLSIQKDGTDYYLIGGLVYRDDTINSIAKYNTSSLTHDSFDYLSEIIYDVTNDNDYYYCACNYYLGTYTIDSFFQDTSITDLGCFVVIDRATGLIDTSWGTIPAYQHIYAIGDDVNNIYVSTNHATYKFQSISKSTKVVDVTWTNPGTTFDAIHCYNDTIFALNYSTSAIMSYDTSTKALDSTWPALPSGALLSYYFYDNFLYYGDINKVTRLNLTTKTIDTAFEINDLFISIGVDENNIYLVDVTGAFLVYDILTLTQDTSWSTPTITSMLKRSNIVVGNTYILLALGSYDYTNDTQLIYFDKSTKTHSYTTIPQKFNSSALYIKKLKL